MNRFVVFSLPRSRSAWLSKFLSYREWECGHEQLRYMRSLEDVKTWLSLDSFGSCETAGAPYWRLLLKFAPDIRVVTVRRPIDDVMTSLSALGASNLDAVKAHLLKIDRKLDQLEGRMPNVRSYSYSDLNDEAACKDLFEFCINNHSHDSDRWKQLSGVNIQINFGALTRFVSANMGAINKLSAIAGQVMFSDMAVKSSVFTGSIEEESFETWRRDCQDLFRQHCAGVNEHPQNWENKNIPLMQKLYEVGGMQIMVARLNGRPFGYLMSIISPSLEEEGRLVSQHTTFFADKSMPGVGLKLQRAAMAKLKEKNVKELFMRDGIRGDGGRMHLLYKRLGAQPFGNMYRVELGA